MDASQAIVALLPEMPTGLATEPKNRGHTAHDTIVRPYQVFCCALNRTVLHPITSCEIRFNLESLFASRRAVLLRPEPQTSQLQNLLHTNP
jgi:hypothetical protein